MSDFISVSGVRRLVPRGWRRVQVGHDEWADEWRPLYDVVDVSGPRSWGYAFELRDGARVVARSVDRWEPETVNRVGRLGAMRVGFRRSDLPWYVW